jgi:hypothetical protein
VQRQLLKMLIWILKLQVETLLMLSNTVGYECANSCCFMTCCPVQLKIVTPSNFSFKWISWYGRLDSMCIWSEGVLVELSLLCTIWEFWTFFGNIEDSILVNWWILMSFLLKCVELPPQQLLDCLSKQLRQRLVNIPSPNIICIFQTTRTSINLLHAFFILEEWVCAIITQYLTLWSLFDGYKGLRLFNLDIIREGGAGNQYYVIDINYFPGKNFLNCFNRNKQ